MSARQPHFRFIMPTLISNLPERYIQNDLRPSLVGLSRDMLMEMLARVGVPEKQRKMRANQIFHWIYHKGVTSFLAMTTYRPRPARKAGRGFPDFPPRNRHRAEIL